MKPLLVEILESILSTDEKLAYVITCDEEELVSLTRDTSLACNQKESDEYVGVNAVDEARIPHPIALHPIAYLGPGR